MPTWSKQSKMPSNEATTKKQRIFIYSLCWWALSLYTYKCLKRKQNKNGEKAGSLQERHAGRPAQRWQWRVTLTTNDSLPKRQSLRQPASQTFLAPRSLLALSLYSPPRRTSSSQNSMWHLNFIIPFLLFFLFFFLGCVFHYTFVFLHFNCCCYFCFVLVLLLNVVPLILDGVSLVFE